MKILLIVYDNGSFIQPFPHGIAYIASVLKKEGHEVTIYNQDLHHYPEEHLTEYLNIQKFHIVGVSIIAGYYQYAKLLKISEAINASKQRPLYLLGGHGPSPEPEYFLKKTQADIVVIGEGEETIIDLSENLYDLSKVKGIAYRVGDEVTVNERRPLLKDIDTIPFPAYELLPMEYYRLMRYVHVKQDDFCLPMLSGRGCIFKCTFCYRMDEGFRPRSPESIIEEIRLVQKDYGISIIDFTDELLMSSKERTIKLCEAFIKANLKFRWHCNGRLNFATPEVLRIMKEAGCIFINYGIEALDDNVLQMMRKGLTVEIIVTGVERTLKAGISPGLNIIWGNIGDTRATLEKAVQFLMRYDDGAQLRTIRPVTPYPGSELYYDAIKMGLLKDCADFYENKHVNSDLLSVNFTNIPDKEFHEFLFKANCLLLANFYKHKYRDSAEKARELYIDGNTNFRGFRQY